MRILATLIAADAGLATVCGYNVTRDAQKVRQNIGLTGQYTSVDENLMGVENLVMIGQLLDMPRSSARARAGELLAWFDLTEASGRPAKTYSGGMRRRLNLASSLVGCPRMVFLDEPTTGQARGHVGSGLRLTAQPHMVDGLAGIARPRVVPRVSLHQFPDGQLGRHARDLQHQPDPRPPGQRRMGRIHAQLADIPRIPPAVSLQHLDRRGLARAVRAHEGEYLPLPHGEVNSLDHLDVPVSLPQPGDRNDRRILGRAEPAARGKLAVFTDPLPGETGHDPLWYAWLQAGRQAPFGRPRQCRKALPAMPLPGMLPRRLPARPAPGALAGHSPRRVP